MAHGQKNLSTLLYDKRLAGVTGLSSSGSHRPRLMMVVNKLLLVQCIKIVWTWVFVALIYVVMLSLAWKSWDVLSWVCITLQWSEFNVCSSDVEMVVEKLYGNSSEPLILIGHR